MVKRRKPRTLWRDDIIPKKQRRIELPDKPTRPLELSGDQILRERFQEDPGWLVVHKKYRRGDIGGDPREKRAQQNIPGFLPERMLYKWLVSKGHMKEGVDFIFQSSQQGGRTEFGGLVVDFLFPVLKMAIQVQGEAWHTDFAREKKDLEQKQILEAMGFQVYLIHEDDIYDEYRLEEIMRRILGFGSATGNPLGSTNYYEPDYEPTEVELDYLWPRLVELKRLAQVWASR